MEGLGRRGRDGGWSGGIRGGRERDERRRLGVREEGTDGWIAVELG